MSIPPGVRIASLNGPYFAPSPNGLMAFRGQVFVSPVINPVNPPGGGTPPPPIVAVHGFDSTVDAAPEMGPGGFDLTTQPFNRRF